MNDKKKIAREEVRRLDIKISGSGGQGVISTGMILGKAVALYDNRNVSQTQAYGPQARGGATYTDVIISDEDIYFPECDKLDILVSFTFEAYDKFSYKVKPDGLIIVDADAIDVKVGTVRTLEVPFLKTAVEKFNSPIVANIICLGFISTFVGIVTEKALKEVITRRFEQSPHAEINIKALQEGFELGREYLEKED